MGQTTRSQGISFTHEMWARIESRCRELKFGRSQYFQMLVEWDLHFLPDIHAHKADGKWHFYPEPGSARGGGAPEGRRGPGSRLRPGRPRPGKARRRRR